MLDKVLAEREVYKKTAIDLAMDLAKLQAEPDPEQEKEKVVDAPPV